MLAQLRKDVYVTRRGAVTTAALLALFALIGPWSTRTMGRTYVTLILPFAALSPPLDAVLCDERSRWDRFAATTPLGPWRPVLGRYLLAWGTLALSLGLVLLEERLVVWAAWTCFRAAWVYKTSGELLVGLALLAEAAALPVVYRLGSRWGRPALLVIWMAAAVGIWFAAASGRADALFGWLEERRWESAAALLVLNVLSVPLSVRFYARRQRGLYRI